MIPSIDSLVWNPSVNVGGKPILLDFCKCSVPQISCLSHMWMCSNIFRVRPTSFSLLPLPNMNVNKAYFLLFWVQKVCCVYIYLFLVAHNEVYSENWFRVHFYVNHDVKSSYRCLQSEYFAFHTFTTRATETWLKNQMMLGSSIWTTKLLLRRSTVEDNSTSNKQCGFIKYGIIIPLFEVLKMD